MRTRFVTRGVLRALQNLKREILIWLRHSRSLWRIKRQGLPVSTRLHLGAGQNYKQGWLNVDLCPGGDLFLDLREELPFIDGSIECIYTEHFLEHLQYPETARRFPSECCRVLSERGGIRIGVPDTEWPLQAYGNSASDSYFKIAAESWHPGWCRTSLEHINYHFRQDGEHLFAYDYETLEMVLLEAGFTDVRQSAFDAGVDSEDRRTGTLYVTARKGR